MAGRRAQRPRVVSGVQSISVEDPNTDRAISAVRDAVVKLQSTRERAVVTADLVIGENRIRHGLGRRAIGYTITPSIATIAFAHALTSADALEAVITVVGSDMPSAVLEVW